MPISTLMNSHLPLAEGTVFGLGWLLAVAIIVVGLAIGLNDVSRFSIRRAWAISSVAFTESLRRWVWLLPIVAFVGVLIVCQLQKPFDEQDAIRQTTKFCLFATGLVVTITIIILACTNLPREIDNRVIYTVVTKPTTRLEIVVGKVLGFARVSAGILLIMGVLTWGYLYVRAYLMERYIAQQLESGTVDDATRPTLEHYKTAGLLNAKTLSRPADLEIYARLPQPGDTRHWFFGNTEGAMLVPFEIKSAADLLPPGVTDPQQNPGMLILLHLDYDQRVPTSQESRDLPARPSNTAQPLGPELPEKLAGKKPEEPKPLPVPQVQVNILDRFENTIVPYTSINGGKAVDLPPKGSNAEVPAFVPPDAVGLILRDTRPGEAGAGRFYVHVTGMTAGVQLSADNLPVRIGVPAKGPNGEPTLKVIAPAPGPDGQPSPPIFRARFGKYGQQLKGGTGETPLGVYTFNNAEIGQTPGGQVPFELRVGIERPGGGNSDMDELTDLEVRVRNHKTGKVVGPMVLHPDTQRTAYFSVPLEAVQGGSFDVITRCLTPDHFVGLMPTSLALVSSQESFAFNLFKSLLILWCMATLVVVISIFSSTFLSWPVAVVLTIVILLGQWGVQLLGEDLSAGLGRRVARDFFPGLEPAGMRTLSETVDLLARVLKFISAFLPDISRFAATEDIERGITIPGAKLLDAAAVLFGYGLPMTLLAYVFLKKKEVAP